MATNLTPEQVVHDTLSGVEAGQNADALGCDLCGSAERTQLFSGPDRLMGYPGTFSFVRCNSCGMLYQSPQLPWEQLEPYYAGDYTAYATLLKDEASGLQRAIKRIGVLKQRRYVERFLRGGNLLDVGCGTGNFLAEMQQQRAWRLSGLEPTREAAAYVRERLGIPVLNQTFENADLAPNSQDVITMWHVLEHVASPTTTLKKAWELLKPGGYLIFSIPNYESLGRLLFGRFWVGWDLPRHLFVFPRPVLIKLLERHGFRVVDQRCFLISYASLGHSLTFWLQSWPPGLQPLAQKVRRAYYTPFVRAGLYPLQILVERLGLATVTTWIVQKVGSYAAD